LADEDDGRRLEGRIAMRALCRCLLAALLAQLPSSFGVQAQDRESLAPLHWQTLAIPEFGTQVEYPSGLFVPAGNPERGIGKRFDSTDGRAFLSVYSRPNEAGETPASYLKNNLRVRRSALQYERITRSFFAISEERGGLIFYSRCNFSGRAQGSIHCFDMVYPQAEKRAWDPVVTRISLSLRPQEG
jgi:hypothetical protein